MRAGVRNGLRTCLVESGCHASSLQRFFPRDRADYVAANLGELLPRKYTARTALAYPELGLGRAELHDLYRALVVTRAAEERLETLQKLLEKLVEKCPEALFPTGHVRVGSVDDLS